MEVGFSPTITFLSTLVEHNGINIVSLYESHNNKYILDLIPLSGYKKYYCYYVSEENYDLFEQTKNGQYLLPIEDQKVYIIEKKANWEVLDIKSPQDCDLYYYEEQEL